MYAYPTSILNFRCPDNLKSEIDVVCKTRNLSRTSLILRFFEDEVERFKTKNSSVRRVASPHHAPVNVEETNAPHVFFSNTEAERNDW